MPGAGAPTAQTRKPPDQDDASFPGASPEQLDTWDQLEKLRVEAGPNAGHKVHVMKAKADGSGGVARIKAIPLASFDLDQLPELYGGGDYILQITDSRGQYVTRYRVSFDTGVWPPTPAPAGTPPAAPATPATGEGFGQLILLLQQNQQRADDRHAKLLETLLTGLIGAMKPPSTQDMLAQMTAMRALVGENPRAPIELLRDAVKQGIDIANAAAGRTTEDDGEEGGGNMGRLIEKGIDTLAKVLDARRAQPRPAGTPAPAVTIAPGGAAAPRSVPAAPVPDRVRPYLWLASYAPQAIAWAQQGFVAERAAGIIYEAVPDSYLPMLEDFARLPQHERHEILAHIDGRLAPYVGYLDDIAAQLIARFDADTEDDGTEDEPAGATEPA